MPKEIFGENDDIDEKIKQYFIEHGLPHRKLDVVKVSVCYDCVEKLELHEKIQKLEDKILDLK